jgi:hypothetical protein
MDVVVNETINIAVPADEISELEVPKADSTDLGYASPNDSAFVRSLIRSVEYVTGTRTALEHVCQSPHS